MPKTEVLLCSLAGRTLGAPFLLPPSNVIAQSKHSSKHIVEVGMSWRTKTDGHDVLGDTRTFWVLEGLLDATHGCLKLDALTMDKILGLGMECLGSHRNRDDSGVNPESCSRRGEHPTTLRPQRCRVES